MGGDRLSAFLEGSDLRTVRSRGVTIISRIYTAVRDPHWGTAQPHSTSVDVDTQPTSTGIRWHASYDEPGMKLDTEGEYEIGDDGTLVATFRALVHEDLSYNRVGFCLLLPPSEFAGQPVVADGSTRYDLPLDIAPQYIVDGLPAPIFPAVSSLALRGRSGASLRIEFEGDVFEVEDQRNWTDDSFKIYSTPLALGFPHTASAGSRIEQRVAISVEPPASPRKATSASIEITLGRPLGRPVPPLGFALQRDSEIAPAALDLLRDTNPSHLLVSLLTGSAVDALERAHALADRLDAALHVEVPADVESIPSGSDRITDVIVLNAETAAATSAADVQRVRERLSPALPAARFHGGTRGDFCELNRGPMDATGLDGIAYAIQPQAHAFDDTSLFETLSVQAETVTNARRLFPALRVLVGPVTLRARAAAAEPSPDRLPPSVDDRQLSLLAAAWTLGSLSRLAAAGPDAITYYEATGWCGLIETAAGSPLPNLFPSTPGAPFPLFHVLADAGRLKGELLSTSSSDGMTSLALAVTDGGKLSVLVANLVPEPVDIEIAPLPAGAYRIRRLNHNTAALAANDPSAFRSAWEPIEVKGAGLRARLEPYETARLEEA